MCALSMTEYCLTLPLLLCISREKTTEPSSVEMCQKSLIKNTSFFHSAILLILQIQLIYCNKFETRLKLRLSGGIFRKGSKAYENRRNVHNGLCDKIFPDYIIVPESAEDVSIIIKAANDYKLPISVRSGGHSYTCQSIKTGMVIFRADHDISTYVWLR